VIATLPVAGLSGRKPEKSRYQTQREIVQQRSVEQQVVSLPALSIARTLLSLERQIRVPLHADGLIQQFLQEVPVPFHNPLVGAGDRS
jgi:hypothetical protein